MYVDDMVVVFCSPSQHARNLVDVFLTLRAYGLRLKSGEMFFWR